MDEEDFEGTLVLEQLAAIGMVDDFFEAIDSDDLSRAVALMRKADLDASTIAVVVKKMEESDGALRVRCRSGRHLPGAAGRAIVSRIEGCRGHLDGQILARAARRRGSRAS